MSRQLSVSFSLLGLCSCALFSVRALGAIELPTGVLFSEESHAALASLWNVSDGDRENLFASGEIPNPLPLGVYSGFHREIESSPARVPGPLRFATSALWKFKVFADGELRDHLRGVPLHAKASLLVAPLRTVLEAKPWEATPSPILDEKPSLITDYEAVSYGFPLSVLLSAGKGWVDEFRQVQIGDVPVLLGRSTYRGKLWCHVALVPVAEDAP